MKYGKVLLLLLTVVIEPVLAASGETNSASRTPANSIGRSQVVAPFRGSVDLNAAGDAVRMPEGILSVTKVSVDAGRGKIHTYASSTADSLPVRNSTASIANGAFGGYSVISGPGIAPIDITVRLDFDAGFGGQFRGQTSQSFAARVELAIQDTFSGVDGQANEANLSSLAFVVIGNSDIEVTPTATQTLLGGEPHPYAGATAHVENASRDEVSGYVEVHTTIKPGQYFFYGAGITSVATVNPFGLDTIPTQSVTDAWNTASLHITLPTGYSVDTTNNIALRNVVSVVPEPSVALLLFCGLVMLTVESGRRSPRRFGVLCRSYFRPLLQGQI